MAFFKARSTTLLSSVVLLGKIGPSATEAIPVLEAALTHADRRVRKAAAGALRRIKGF